MTFSRRKFLSTTAIGGAGLAFANILREAKNVRPLNMTMRDAVLAYVKAETAAGRSIKATLDGRFSFAGTDKDTSEGDQP